MQADADITVSADGNVRVDTKGNWNSAKRVSSMIEMFGGPKKRAARVIDVKVDEGGKVQMTPAAEAEISSGAGLAGSAGLDAR